MNIIQRYIFKEHISPFFFGLGTIVFVFLLNVIFRDLGRLLGKGLSWWVVLEFFVFNLAWIMALAIPMSVLISTLMAFGRLSAENEIAALKASGVNLYKLITPILIGSVVLAVGMERFQNVVLPDFNHRLRLLYSDISKKRPTLTLEPQVFFSDIPNYTMLVQWVSEDDSLQGIIINDSSDPRFNKTILAKRGRLVYSEEQEQMIFSLYDGEVHEVDRENLENYRRLHFARQSLFIPMSNMSLQRSESQHRGDREKSADMMRNDIVKSRESLEVKEKSVIDRVSKDLNELFVPALWADGVADSSSLTLLKQRPRQRHTVGRIYNLIRSEAGGIRGYRKSINRRSVEIEKKYSISVACIVFVLIGAPLGVMARQGGFGVGGGMSFSFFLIYWAFLIGGEQLADRRLMSPWVAMWLPNILMGALGIYLVIHSVKEMTVIPWQEWGEAITRLVRRKR